MVQVSDGGRGVCTGEGLRVGVRGMRQGPWVVVAYIFRGVERIVREEKWL